MVCFVDLRALSCFSRQQQRRPIECTVVDTHPVLFSQFRTKEFLHLCGKLVSSSDSLHNLKRHAPVDVVSARAARREQHGTLVDWLDPRITADESRASQLEDCRQAEPFLPLYQVKALFDDEFLRAGSHTAALFDQCGFVLGLHPDQATEPIVDACLAADKAFAVRDHASWALAALWTGQQWRVCCSDRWCLAVYFQTKIRTEGCSRERRAGEGPAKLGMRRLVAQPQLLIMQ